MHFIPIGFFSYSDLHICFLMSDTADLEVSSVIRAFGRLSYLSFQQVFHNWCNKSRGMCYPVCGMVHIKNLLLIEKVAHVVSTAGFVFDI